MGSIDPLEFAAAAVVVCGLAFVVWEIIVKSPRSGLETAERCPALCRAAGAALHAPFA